MTLQLLGLCLALLYVLFSLDDLIWDIFYSVTSFLGRKKRQRIHLEDLDATLPRLMAIVVAAWQEKEVLGNVIDNIVASTQYPRSMYQLFLGVYPNDEETIAVANNLAKRHTNVHVVLNKNPGPTCKADNINNVLKSIFQFERDYECRFAGVVVHDSEDVVHPYELKLENYLLHSYPALQIPVFPFQQMPRWSNLFANMTSGTYADEFAENHMRSMVARNDTGAFVPSAGTGFTLSRELLESFNGEDVFPVGSLTEDYKLSLLLEQKGYKLHYVLEDVVRLRNDGTMVHEFISTRSRFPATFKLAVRQKTRWIYGITIQSFKLKEILKNKSLSLLSKYTLYKDWKAKFGNLIIAPGYVLFLYFIASLFIDLPVVYPRFTFSWWLCVALTIMMVERQVLRAMAVKKVYGWKSAAISCFFPPLLPMRMVWGNLINMSATLMAWKQHVLGKSHKKKAAKAPAWSKTDHDTLEQEVLNRFRRNLGDILLQKKLVEPETLKQALAESHRTNRKLGSVLKIMGVLCDEDLLRSLADVHHTQYLPLLPGMVSQQNLARFSPKLLLRLAAIPLLKTNEGWAFAFSDYTPANAAEVLSQASGGNIHVFYSTTAGIKNALRKKNDNLAMLETIAELEAYLRSGSIDCEQAILAWTYSVAHNIELCKVFHQMGVSLALPCPAPAEKSVV